METVAHFPPRLRPTLRQKLEHKVSTSSSAVVMSKEIVRLTGVNRRGKE